MAKTKSKQSAIPNKNLHLRLSFLHEAAIYLANAGDSRRHQDCEKRTDGGNTDSPTNPSETALRRSSYLINQMKGVARKSVIRLNQDVKRSVCKGCDQPLIFDSTSSVTIENKSKNQLRPWADVRIVRCQRCGTTKRYPKRDSKHSLPAEIATSRSLESLSEAVIKGR